MKILSGQYMTPWLLVCSISDNIFMNLANFLGHHSSILLKNISYSCGNTRVNQATSNQPVLPLGDELPNLETVFWTQ